jgi:hypothetical protein
MRAMTGFSLHHTSLLHFNNFSVIEKLEPEISGKEKKQTNNNSPSFGCFY